jgi:DNA polymerase III subunit epsilon
MIIVGGLDLETTGLEQSAGHRIIEIAILLYNLETTAFLGKFVQRINPMRPIDPAAQAVHGITFDQLAAEPVWEVVAPRVSQILSKIQYGIAHNGFTFDFPFLAAELMRVGVTVPAFEPIDTMAEARWATPLGKNPNLRELCFACGVEYDPTKAHGAEYDVEVMMQSYFIARAQGFMPPQLVAAVPDIILAAA